jgi:hypothetical protein
MFDSKHQDFVLVFFDFSLNYCRVIYLRLGSLCGRVLNGLEEGVLFIV